MNDPISREREPSAFAIVFATVAGALALGASVWTALGGARDRDRVTAARLPRRPSPDA